MSLPPNTRLREDSGGYAYIVGAGVGTYKYVIDNRINIQDLVGNESTLSAVLLLIPLQEFTKMP